MEYNNLWPDQTGAMEFGYFPDRYPVPVTRCDGRQGELFNIGTDILDVILHKPVVGVHRQRLRRSTQSLSLADDRQFLLACIKKHFFAVFANPIFKLCLSFMQNSTGPDLPAIGLQ